MDYKVLFLPRYLSVSSVIIHDYFEKLYKINDSIQLNLISIDNMWIVE
jgi:hypothetical protein